MGSKAYFTLFEPPLHGVDIRLDNLDQRYEKGCRRRVWERGGDGRPLAGAAWMRVVVLRVTATAKAEKREVVRIDLEAVFVTEDLEERSELRVRYLGGSAASFTHKVFVVVI